MLCRADTRQKVRALALSAVFVFLMLSQNSASAPTASERDNLPVSRLSPEISQDELGAFTGMTVPTDPVFLFSRSTAKPGDRVTVRSSETPRNFRPTQRSKPLQEPIRLYLVLNTVAGQVRSRFDSRVFFVGAVVLDRRGRGLLTFSVPPVDSGSFAIASWCSRCARENNGRSFFIQRDRSRVAAHYRAQMLLRVTAPDPALACPVTVPNGSTPPGLKSLAQYHGNGMLWVLLPGDGVYRARAESDGTFFEKILWFAAGINGELFVSAQRLDTPASAPRTQSVPGSPPGFRGSGSWASRVWFTSEGCWEVAGRIRDVSLTVVVRVVQARD
jgi:hypothetical protein